MWRNADGGVAFTTHFSLIFWSEEKEETASFLRVNSFPVPSAQHTAHRHFEKYPEDTGNEIGRSSVVDVGGGIQSGDL